MKLDPVLSRAAFLAKKRNYENALKLLKAEEDRYYGSFKYYYLYGIICLHSGAAVEALSNFKLASQIKMRDPSLMLAFAALYLKRMNTVQAIDYYLDVQEIDPKNKIAKRALSVMRNYSTSDALSDWLTPSRIAKLFPPIPGPVLDSRTIGIGALGLVLALFLFCIALVGFKVLPSPFKSRQTRPTADFTLSVDERRSPVETGGSYMYILTRDQATGFYDRALSLFAAYRDEAAKINLNRLLESNASDSLKNKSRLLFSYMEPPGFDSFKRSDNPSYADVRSEPAIYRNVHVIWRGMATNVEVTDEYIRFDLLVGYDTRRSLEGIVPVFFYNPVNINTERPLEVLGKVILLPSYTDIRLEGVAIHQSGRLE
ncbi:MAG: tetratricopeptide repeat protein [Treponema sp.]|jgi:tetratricopeptide (TPR) repeat protein|nr:tetratricopeptide repeat protein [Treponema sp.]